MSLTIEQLDEALFCAQEALNHLHKDVHVEIINRTIAVLEAEIDRLDSERAAKTICWSCAMYIHTTDDHLSHCKDSEWLPPLPEGER